MTNIYEETCAACGGRTRWHTPPDTPFPPGVVGLKVHQPQPRLVCDHCHLDNVYLQWTACWPEIEELRDPAKRHWVTHQEFVELEAAILQKYTVRGDPPETVLSEVEVFSTSHARMNETIANTDEEDTYWHDSDDEPAPYLSTWEVRGLGQNITWILGRSGIRSMDSPHVKVPPEQVLKKWTLDTPEVSFALSTSDYIRIVGADRIGPNTSMWHRLNTLRATVVWF